MVIEWFSSCSPVSLSKPNVATFYWDTPTVTQSRYNNRCAQLMDGRMCRQTMLSVSHGDCAGPFNVQRSTLCILVYRLVYRYIYLLLGESDARRTRAAPCSRHILLEVPSAINTASLKVAGFDRGAAVRYVLSMALLTCPT